MKKLTLLAAGAVGYVLGTRAGRERYEQIKNGATKIAQDPRVQEKAQQAGDAVKQHAPVVKDRLTDAAGAAKHAAQDRVGGSGPDQTAPYPQS